MPWLPPDATADALAEDARAAAYRLQARRRAAARAARARARGGSASALVLLIQHWAALLDPLRDIGDTDDEQGQKGSVNG